MTWQAGDLIKSPNGEIYSVARLVDSGIVLAKTGAAIAATQRTFEQQGWQWFARGEA